MNEQERQKVIELLKPVGREWPKKGLGARVILDEARYNSALAILKQPECETCEDSKMVNKPAIDVGDGVKRIGEFVDCPDCQKPPESGFTTLAIKLDKYPVKDNEQPPESEFTKKCRELMVKYTGWSDNDTFDLLENLQEACDRLDKAEADRQALIRFNTKYSILRTELEQRIKELENTIAEKE